MPENGSDTSSTEESTVDVDAIAESISDDLFGSTRTEEEPVEDEAVTTETETPTAKTTTPASTTDGVSKTGDTTAESVSEMPKSWQQDLGDLWKSIPPAAQQYYLKREKQMLDGLQTYKEGASFAKSVSDVMTPYMQDINEQAQGNPQQAIKLLLEANRKLTRGTLEQRQAAFQDLGRRLGITASGTQVTPAQQIDPALRQLQETVNQIQQEQTARAREQYQQVLEKTTAEVNAFATDAAHPYFDECSDHIVRLIKVGFSLQEAYDTAIMANPITKAKEVARIQTEARDQLKENARLQALPKKQAAGANVRGRETRRAPTEPLGSLEDVIRDTLTEQRSRAS